MASLGAANPMQAMTAVKWPSVQANFNFSAVASVEAMLGLSIVIVLLRVELQRRALNSTHAAFGTARNRKTYVESFRLTLYKCAPELFGLLACTSIAWVLLNYGMYESNLDGDEQSREVWERIKSEWPLLTCADTLLSLQALLRVVMLTAALLHGDSDGLTPMSDETAVLYMGGCVARVLLLLRTSNYVLDGPMGGNLPNACDIACLPLAFGLGRKALWRNRKAAIATIVSVGWFASRHCLNLANGDATSDALFMAAYVFDALVAFVYLARSLLIEAPFCCVRLSRHLLMAAQAALGGYYFIVIDALKAPSLVGAGHPILLLQSCNMVASGAYLGAAAMLLAELSVGEDTEGR